jgi:4-hydroxybenzoate polyprenyltransferase
MSQTLGQIARFIRWRDWGVGKLILLWNLCLYIALTYQIPFITFFLTAVVFLIFAASQSAFGYVLNDWSDCDLDKRQLKRNSFIGLNKLESYIALGLMVIVAFISGMPLINRPGFGLLWLAWIAAAVAYSSEPLRLKTRGLVGLTVSFVAQWFLPVLITFAAFQAPITWETWVLAAALTVSGATLEIAHQRYDRVRDRITSAETFAVGLSDAQVDRLYAAALIADKLAIGACTGVMALALRRLDAPWATILAAVLVVGYVMLALATLPGAWAGFGVGELIDPYYTHRDSIARLLHETLLNLLVPLTLGVALTVIEPLYAIALGIFLVWRLNMGSIDWTWPVRAVRTRGMK